MEHNSVFGHVEAEMSLDIQIETCSCRFGSSRLQVYIHMSSVYLKAGDRPGGVFVDGDV